MYTLPQLNDSITMMDNRNIFLKSFLPTYRIFVQYLHDLEPLYYNLQTK